MPDNDSSQHPPRRPGPIAATLKALIRTRITTGLIVVLPIYVTYWLLRLVFQVMRDSSLWVLELFLRSEFGMPILQRWRVPITKAPAGTPPPDQPAVGAVPEPEVVLVPVARKLEMLEERLGRPADLQEFFGILPETMQWGVSIFAVLLTIFILYTIGLFAANIVGRRFIETFDRMVEQVPLVKTVYRSVKQMLATLTGDQSQNFQRVALIPFPQEKMRCVGFVTNVFRDSLTGDELCSVFIPTTPNPTTGYLQVMKRSEITELNWSVEDGFRTIMSAGILKPEFLTILPNRQLPEHVRPPREIEEPQTAVDPVTGLPDQPRS